MSEQTQDSIPIDEQIEEMSDERIRVAFDRAVREFGGAVADYESEEFVAAFNEQLKLMVATDFMEDLQERGYVTTREVDANGNAVFVETEAGAGALHEPD